MSSHTFENAMGRIRKAEEKKTSGGSRMEGTLTKTSQGRSLNHAAKRVRKKKRHQHLPGTAKIARRQVTEKKTNALGRRTSREVRRC